MPASRSSGFVDLRGAAKIGATIALLVLAPAAWIPTAAAKASALVVLDMPVLATVYVVTVLIGVAATAGAPFVREPLVRWSLVLTFLIGFGANFIAQSIQGQALTSHMLATLFQAWKEYDHAILTYGRHFVTGLTIVALLGPLLLMQPPPELALGRWFLFVPPAAIALTALLIGAFPGRLEELPSTIALPVQTYFAGKEATVYMGPRDRVVYRADVSPKFDKVIFIVDESIRGDYLQINNAALDNTPFLRSALPHLANFGLATSFSNCSATARVALRSGARDDDFPDPGARTLHRPTFWQFAKRADYRTVYIDTWMPVRRMSSMLTYDELTYVDERAAVPLTPYSAVDDRVADRIIEEINRPGRTFLFVEKIGLHSPYARNLPPDLLRSAVTGGVSLRPDLDPSRARVVREYILGVGWRVDRFFQRLLPAIHEADVLVIYTSDHGQALYDAGYDASNCSGPEAAQGEGVIPLLVFASNDAALKAFQASAARRQDAATQGDIFPTLLWAMGFDRTATTPAYATSLLDIPARASRRFFVFSPFQNTVQWVTVN
jgi:lipid A ethanolaminephosphotransferase